MKDVIIIGSGPAGISASLYTKRANLETLVISNGIGALLKTDKIENYYGFSEPVSGKELEQNGIDGAKRLGVEFTNGEVVSLGYDGNFIVNTTDNEYKGKALLLATGSRRLAPKIDGIEKFEGKGISYCAVCDAFFFRGKDVGVLGSGEYALHEAQILLDVAKSVTVFTNGEKLTADFPENISVLKGKIQAFEGNTKVEHVLFSDGLSTDIDGVFVAYGVAGTAALAKKLGAVTDGGNIRVNENMQTTIKGMYAAGDCTGGLLQISKAVYEGAKAGTEIIKYIKSLQK